jgi:hypothetical protein
MFASDRSVERTEVRMSGSGEEKNVHWYYKIEGREAGPAMISRLRQMAREGSLTSEDLVRTGMTGEWVRAGTVSEIHARARTVTVEVPTQPEPNEVPVERNSRLQELRLSLLYALSRAVGSVIERLSLVRTLAGYAILVAALAYLALTITGWRIFNRPRQADPMTAYKSLWTELQTHRKNKVDEAVWREFSERGRKELAPIISRLEREAGIANRSAQFLLWAGRDCLPLMFNDARNEPSSSEQQFAEYLENVQLLSQGKPVYGGIQSGRQSRLPETFSLRNWIERDPVAAGLSGLLAAAGFVTVIWYKRRSSRGIS